MADQFPLTAQEEQVIIRAACDQYPLQNSLLSGLIPKMHVVASPRAQGGRPALFCRPSYEPFSPPESYGCESTKSSLREQRKTSFAKELSSRTKVQRSITHTSELEFLDFIDIFKSFNLHGRKDPKELFDQMCTACMAANTGSPNASMDLSVSSSLTVPLTVSLPLHGHSRQLAGEKSTTAICGLITRVSIYDDDYHTKRRKICDAIAVSSIISNSVGTGQVAKDKLLSVSDLRYFFSHYQQEGTHVSPLKKPS